MTVQENPYPLRADRLIMQKIRVIAAKNNRSVNKEIVFLLQKRIESYERHYGKIHIPDIDE